MRLFNLLFDNIRRRYGYFIFLSIITIAIIVLAVFSAINFDGGVLPIDLSNVPYIRYLKDDCSFFFLIFGNLLTLTIFIGFIIFFSWKKYLLPLSLILYLYFVYSQIVIYVSLILIYGFFNTIILIILLTIFLLIEFLLLLLILISLIDCCGANNFFSLCFNRLHSPISLLLLCLLITTLLFSIILALLRTFVILLVY